MKTKDITRYNASQALYRVIFICSECRNLVKRRFSGIYADGRQDGAAALEEGMVFDGDFGRNENPGAHG